MDVPVFEWLRGRWPDKALVWDLAKRPIRGRGLDAHVLDPDTVIVATAEAGLYRALVSDWHARDARHRRAAEDITDTQHQLDLEEAAQPPVIEVTVTTPPEGVPRADLVTLVRAKVAEMTDPAGLPVLGPAGPAAQPRRRRKVLRATRRALSRRVPVPVPPPVPVPEDDRPTVVLPALPASPRPDETQLIASWWRP